MNAPEQIIFKVFYEKGNPIYDSESTINSEDDSNEVRKIVFACNPDFKQLCDGLVNSEKENQSKIQEDNSRLLPKHVRIKYLDEDGDKITIVCDDELQILIGEKVCYS